ncbi:hypothetical protein FS749_007219 [Ceratobasidium sp. UAMH 11750]|nr:hypothetical protein FS749_007219 [Ceratobasidium sp. UAMH 11750]
MSDNDLARLLPRNGGPLDSKEYSRVIKPSRAPRLGIGMLWPLILHCATSLGIAYAVFRGVNNHNFDTREQPLSASFTDAIKMRYGPSQSDITTILSASITILRTIAAAWSGPLYWRSAFLLLEKTGLKRRDLKRLVSFGPSTPVAYFKGKHPFFIGIIFLGTLPAQLAGPILTGSISWVPSTRTADSVAAAALRVSTISDSSPWGGYSGYTPRRRYTTLQAVGHVTAAWGRDSEVGALKRVIPSAASLPVGSIITNVTLPYFSVTSLEWITNPTQTLTPNQLDTYGSVAANLSTFGSDNPLLSICGTFALIQDSPWSARPFPEPSIVSETRALVVYTHWNPTPGPCGRNNSVISNSLPAAMGYYQVNGACFAFARVAYDAGVGVCANCRVSSPSTAQNDSALILQEDSLTTEALRMMPDIISSLALINTSIPSTWGNFDDYIIGVLGRSYSGAWSALTEYLSEASLPLTSNFTPAVPSSQAHVALWRVGLWLSIQLLATVSGIIFIIMQSRAKNRLVGDTALAAFYLDTTAVPRHRSVEREGSLRLRKVGDRLKVVVE